MLTYSPVFVYKQERINGEAKSFIRADSNMIMKMSSACNSSICIWLGTDHLTCKVGDYEVFFSFRFFFTHNTRVRIFFFSCKAQFIFPEINIRLYVKNSESDYFVFLHQNHNFFQQHWESEYFFRKKTIAPPPPGS
jgi:hypothetical protein